MDLIGFRRAIHCFFVAWIVHCCIDWGVGGISPASGAPPEVRATWLTTTGPDHIRGGGNTENIIGQLRNAGLNTVYVESWKNGYTNFPSSTLAGIIGHDRTPSLGGRDIIDETLVNAHRNNMIAVAWFEYGFSSQFVGASGLPNNPLSQYMLGQSSVVNGQTVQGWLLRDQNGNYGNGSNGFAWMNPAVPEVRQFLIDMTLEAVRNYDLDGIQFDDRLAWPREFGWDATTAAIYRQETGRELPVSVNDSHFRQWRQSKVTMFASELYTTLKAEEPNLMVSVSPSVTGFSDTNYNAPWSEWVADGLFDEYVPQVYRNSLSSFAATLPSNVAPFTAADRLADLVVGTRINGGGGDTPQADVLQMMDLTRSTAGGELGGSSLWYSDGVIRNLSSLTNYYNSIGPDPAPHPRFEIDHRPDGLVATYAGGQQWRANVDQAGDYRVAALVDGRWGEVDLQYFSSGLFEVTVPLATRVELLRSRRLVAERPGDFNWDGQWDAADADALVLAIVDNTTDLGFDLNGDGLVDGGDVATWRALAGRQALGPGLAYLPADANLDGVVDVADFDVWNANRFTAGGAWSRADFNADGAVDLGDFHVWSAYKFQASWVALPEPSGGMLAWIAMLGWRMRPRGKRVRTSLAAVAD